MADLSSARLVALVTAGPYRLALPAEVVREVARLPPEDAERRDEWMVPLVEALGDHAKTQGGWALALDLAAGLHPFRVDDVAGVRELVGVPFYNLPQGLGIDPPELFHGAVSLDGGLALELRPELLEGLVPRPSVPPPPLQFVDEDAPKALIFTLAGRSMGFPLSHVLSVVAKPRICPVPRAAPGVVGVVELGQTLYGAMDLGALHFGRPSVGEYGILVEQDDRSWLVLADAVRGVRDAFRRTSDGEPGWMEGERGERALFVRLQSS